MFKKLKAFRARRKHFRALMRRQSWYDKRSPYLFGMDLTYTPFTLDDIRDAVHDESKYHWWRDRYWSDEQWARSGLRVTEDKSTQITFFNSFVKREADEAAISTIFTVRNGEIDIPLWVLKEDRVRITREYEEFLEQDSD